MNVSQDVLLVLTCLGRNSVWSIVREEFYVKSVAGYNSCFTYTLSAFLYKDDINLLAMCLEKLLKLYNR